MVLAAWPKDILCACAAEKVYKLTQDLVLRMKGVEEDGELQGNTKAAKTTLIKPQVTVDYEPFVFNALMFVLCLQICSSFRMKPICFDEFKFWGKFFS